eukprot:TRINITY_DN23669_c0_g1_i1.p1 TRINITY_DN23669_c0_g1~~TRINITY_DN23669_c0_g1_i1.p1  ORF type:complete len:105 (+),score=29.74 TRINITY_DN23669_c0_g1_i1:45-317(+)
MLQRNPVRVMFKKTNLFGSKEEKGASSTRSVSNGVAGVFGVFIILSTLFSLRPEVSSDNHFDGGTNKNLGKGNYMILNEGKIPEETPKRQ